MKKAFTLLEIIITIVLITFLTSIGLPITIGYLQGSDSETITRQLTTQFIEQQQNSYTKKDKVFNSSTEICYGINFSNLASSKSYDLYSGNWDSVNTDCTITKTTTKKVSGNSTLTSSIKKILFYPGSFRPIPLGYTSINNSTTVSASISHFTRTLDTGDSIALSSSPSTCATVTTNPIVSDTSIAVGTALGNGSDNQSIIKCVSITIKNNTNTYVINITDEGAIYYQKTA